MRYDHDHEALQNVINCIVFLFNWSKPKYTFCEKSWSKFWAKPHHIHKHMVQTQQSLPHKRENIHKHSINDKSSQESFADSSVAGVVLVLELHWSLHELRVVYMLQNTSINQELGFKLKLWYVQHFTNTCMHRCRKFDEFCTLMWISAPIMYKKRLSYPDRRKVPAVPKNAFFLSSP